jgi:hypothetical protein
VKGRGVGSEGVEMVFPPTGKAPYDDVYSGLEKKDHKDSSPYRPYCIYKYISTHTNIDKYVY